MTPCAIIAPSSQDDWSAALRALFAGHSDRDQRAARALELFASGEFDPAGLLVARVDEQVAGAVLLQFHPGAAAVTWPPGAEPGPDQNAIVAQLAWAVTERLRSAGVKQAQALVPPADRDRARPLEAVGFRHATRLTFLCRPVTGSIPPGRSPLRFAAADATFTEALLATYEDTLDCPELNGTRTADEVLAGYRATAGRPPDWWQVSAGPEPVGVVMLAPGPRPGIAELSYLGLRKSARGRGWGRELVRFALGRAAASDAEWMILSADTRNEPALRIYRAEGFREYDLQDVFLWQPNQ